MSHSLSVEKFKKVTNVGLIVGVSIATVLLIVMGGYVGFAFWKKDGNLLWPCEPKYKPNPNMIPMPPITPPSFQPDK